MGEILQLEFLQKKMKLCSLLKYRNCFRKLEVFCSNDIKSELFYLNVVVPFFF